MVLFILNFCLLVTVVCYKAKLDADVCLLNDRRATKYGYSRWKLHFKLKHKNIPRKLKSCTKNRIRSELKWRAGWERGWGGRGGGGEGYLNQSVTD